MAEKYSLEWLKDLSCMDYQEVKELVHKRHKLIYPACGCIGKILYNKVKHRTSINKIELKIESLVNGTSD